MIINNSTPLYKYDNKLWKIIELEHNRQKNTLTLIASENYVSTAILEVQKSLLTNKYAEGYPKNRYYSGCRYIDIIESLAIHRAKTLFKSDYANVQPHSGSQANSAVMMALLKPGDTILGMDLSHGGHLTHGSKVNFSGKLYNAYTYKISHDTGLIDYDYLEKLAFRYKPKMIISGFSSYSRIINWKRFKIISEKVNAYLLADISHVSGLIAAGLYPSPVPYADIVTSTTHKTLRGPRGGLILSKKNKEIESKINSAVFPGLQGGPLMHIIAGKAIALYEASQPSFIEYQKQVLYNAKSMVNTLKNRGYNIISGTTDNHLFVIDLSNKKITGRDADIALSKANIIVNRNIIPNDIYPPNITSGLRIGTPAITTRGLKEKEAILISTWIADILDNINNINTINRIKRNIYRLCKKFPIYSG